MRFSAFSVLMSFAVLTLLGTGLVSRLSLQFLPIAQAPSVTVRYTWRDAAPEVLEQEVTTLLEGAFSLVKGVRKIYSVSGNGTGNIRLDFDKNAPLDYLRFEIASKIRQLYPRLPAGVSYPTIEVNQPDEKQEERPLLVYSLSGNDSPSLLYRYALERLNPQLALTEGIRTIDVVGGNEQEWLITYDAAQLASLRLDPETLTEALRQYFRSEALGMARQGDYDVFIQLRNRNYDAEPSTEEWLAIPLATAEGRAIRLGDVARVQLAERPPRQYYRINGQNSIRLIFYPERYVNTLQLAAQIKKNITNIISTLPDSYRLHLEDDSTEYLYEELQKIRSRTLLSLSILLAFVLLVYRSFRYLAVVVCSLAANLGLAFIFYYIFQVDIHLYALAGITVSFGMVIDNTIVMAHHIRTQGNMKVFPALLAATLTTISALVIIFFLPELWKTNLLDFGKVIIINLGVSLIIAALLVPALLEKIVLKTGNRALSYAARRRIIQASKFYERLLTVLCRYRPAVIGATILLFGLPVFLLPNKIENQEWYNKTLGSDWYIDNIKPLVNRVLGGTLRLFSQYVYEGSAYREPDETVLFVQGSMPPGATLEQMNTVFRQVEQYLAQFGLEIRQYTTQVSNGQFGMTRIYFNQGYDFSFPYILRSRMIAYSINLGGVKWNIYGVGRGFSNDSGGAPPRFRVQMYGYDKTELERQADRFADKLLAHPRIQEVNTNANINWWEKDLYQYEMTLQPDALAQRKVSLQTVNTLVAPYNRAYAPALYTANGRAARVLNDDLLRNDLWLLEHRTMRLTDSTALAFSEIGTLKKQKVSTALHKENQQYLRMIEFEYTGSAQFGKKYLEQCMNEMRLEMPLGYTMQEITWRFGRKESQKLYGLLLLVVGLIFFICAIQFESLRQSLAIIILIPVSFIGIFITFYAFDIYFDQGGYTSFVVVSGLVVNSLIFILNDRNAFRRQYSSRSDIQLFVKAFRHKIVPILLTIFSTGLGLIPFLTIGKQDVFWYALAAGVIGGLVFSLFVISVFCPVIICKIKR
ncbi:MAG TPA: efflux RND transporter permease subunit [Saprospiraceae bacterium]|nr:efflux RND transporter permease subunit [Saprospiraceae bacterium]HMP25740.1 efflux RND transporter permease subunit [Saprospiraceae bacterium]